MSELKVHKIGDLCFDFKMGKDVGIDFYLKSEADEVIAKLKTEIEEQKRLRDMALASMPNVLKVIKIIQHQKYKRCLKNAESCLYKVWYYDEVHDRNGARRIWKWRERWFDIAKQFKEGK